MDQETYGFEEDFQRVIAATALKDPSFLREFDDILLPSYFDHSYLSSIIRISRELTERLGEVPTKFSVVEEVKDYCERFSVAHEDRDYILNQLEDLYAMEIRDVEYVRERVLQFGQRQALRSAILKVATLFQNKKRKHEDTYSKAKVLLESALRAGVDVRDMGFSFYPNISKIPQLAAKSSSGLMRKVPTGIPTVDTKTNGGPGRGEVWVVVGFPGRGKSAYLVNMGANALRHGIPVIHCTIGDLNEVDVALRYAARMTKCTTYEVLTNTDKFQRNSAIVGKYNPHLHIKYWPSATATMAHVRAYVSKLRVVEEFAPGLVIIDYPEEFKREKGDNLYLEGESNYSLMNKLAAEMDCLVWAASQPKNVQLKGPDDFIKGENMGESWRKFQKIDGMVSWNLSYEDELAGRARLWVDKTRRAKSYYMVHMDVDMESMFMKEGKPPGEDDDA